MSDFALMSLDISNFRSIRGHVHGIPTGATAFPKFERMRCSTAKSAL
jgi:hypothetical protein